MTVPDRVPDSVPGGAAGPDLSAPLRWTERQGTRLLLGGQRPGEAVVGGLVVRVGTADETLATSGITHLVEHLALTGTYVGVDVHTNGSTGERWTVLLSRGTATQVAEFLTRVCARLRRLPLERVPAEIDVLRTEAQRRAPAARSTALLARYGAATYGLLALREVGLHRLSPDEVQRWATTRFGAASTVAFFSAPEVPDGLDLSLPVGLPAPDPDPGDLLGGSPGSVLVAEPGLSVDAVVERTAAAQVLAVLLDEELFRELRDRRACSYLVQARHLPRDSSTASVVLAADALPEKQAELTAGMLGVLDAAATSGFPAERVAAAVATVQASLDTPPETADRLVGTAVAVLSGRPAPDDAVHRVELAAVDPEQVRAVARQVRETALVLCPTTAAADVVRAGFPPLPTADGGRLADARSFQRIGVVGQFVLIGDEGIAESGRGGGRRIRWQDCRAVLAFPDGGRQVIGRHGETIVVEPGLLSGMSARTVPALVDARVDPALLVPLPARAPQDVPRFGAGRTVVEIIQALLIGLSVTLLVAAVVAGFTDELETGLGLALFSLPVWLGTGWLVTARRARRRAAARR